MATPKHWADTDIASITASIPALICSYDSEHICRFANDRFEGWFGRSPDDFIGMHMREILGEDEYGRCGPFLKRAAAGEEVAFDARSLHRDGSMRDLSVRYVPQFIGGVYDGFLALVFETASHQHRFHSVFDASPVAYWELDHSQRTRGPVAASAKDILPNLRLINLNRAAEDLFQISREEALDSSILDFCPPSSLPELQALADALRAGQARFEVETRLLRKDRTPLDVVLSCVFPLAENIRSTITLAIIDLTERKARAAAVEVLRSELYHAARVAMLGELTASIAHEVNQPLGAIVNNGSAALRWLNRSEPAISEVRQSLEMLVGEAKRASEIIIRMRALASKGELDRKPLDPADLMRDVQAIIGGQVRSLGAKLSVENNAAARPLWADAVQLQQVLVNLVMNAAQAMAEQPGRREVRLEAATENDSVRFTVEDTGPGIPADKLSTVFDAFYTTKPTGMGIGLSVSKSIVEAHGGFVSADAASPGGARFVVWLPYADHPT